MGRPDRPAADAHPSPDLPVRAVRRRGPAGGRAAQGAHRAGPVAEPDAAGCGAVGGAARVDGPRLMSDEHDIRTV